MGDSEWWSPAPELWLGMSSTECPFSYDQMVDVILKGRIKVSEWWSPAPELWLGMSSTGCPSTYDQMVDIILKGRVRNGVPLHPNYGSACLVQYVHYAMTNK